MKKIIQGICLLTTIFLFSCESPDFDLAWHEERLGITAEELQEEVPANAPSWCKDGYDGPEQNPQADSFCGQVFLLRCAGLPLNSPNVISVCNTFNALASYSCPYCP